jgi:lipid-binding SYLF domain-containing protein
MLFMNEHALSSLLTDRFKLGGDVSVAAGPVGRDAAADTDVALRAEILSYSRTRGVFAGASISGAYVQVDHGEDKALYGPEVNQREILHGGVPIPEAAGRLVADLGQYPARRQ